MRGLEEWRTHCTTSSMLKWLSGRRAEVRREGEGEGEGGREGGRGRGRGKERGGEGGREGGEIESYYTTHIQPHTPLACSSPCPVRQSQMARRAPRSSC